MVHVSCSGSSHHVCFPTNTKVKGAKQGQPKARQLPLKEGFQKLPQDTFTYISVARIQSYGHSPFPRTLGKAVVTLHSHELWQTLETWALEGNQQSLSHCSILSILTSVSPKPLTQLTRVKAKFEGHVPFLSCMI